MKKLHLFLFASLAIIFPACKKDLTKGSGDIITEHRATAAFTNIEVEGDPRLFITYGQALKVSIKGYENLLPLFDTHIIGNTLKAGYKPGTNIKNNNVRLHITMPQLTGVYTKGGVDTQIYGEFPHVEIMNFEAGGSGSTTIESGSTSKLTINSAGSAGYHLIGLKAQEANIKIAGSGSIRTSVAEKLKVKIDGSGSVYYQGSPDVQLELNGTGKVSKL